MFDATLEFVFGIGRLLVALVALGAAARFIRSSPSTAKGLLAGLLQNRVSRIAVWLAFAGLLTMPLADALTIVQSLPQILSPTAWSSQEIFATTPWGEAPWPLYLILTDILVLGTYVVTYASIWPRLDHNQSATGAPALSQWQYGYLTAIVASLLYRFLSATILQVVWLQIPFANPQHLGGLWGFSLGWITGALFLIFAVHLFPNPLSEVDNEVTNNLGT